MKVTRPNFHKCAVLKKIVSALRASVWSKYKWELAPQAPPFDPPLTYDHEVNH